MKPLFLAVLTLVLTLVFLIAIANISPIYAEEPVANDYFPDSRIVDARECSRYFFFGKSHFLYCLNTVKICNHDVVKNPIGEIFGYRILLPKPKIENGVIEWINETWRTDITDTEMRRQCIKLKWGQKPKIII